LRKNVSSRVEAETFFSGFWSENAKSITMKRKYIQGVKIQYIRFSIKNELQFL